MMMENEDEDDNNDDSECDSHIGLSEARLRRFAAEEATSREIKGISSQFFSGI